MGKIYFIFYKMGELCCKKKSIKTKEELE